MSGQPGKEPKTRAATPDEMLLIKEHDQTAKDMRVEGDSLIWEDGNGNTASASRPSMMDGDLAERLAMLGIKDKSSMIRAFIDKAHPEGATPQKAIDYVKSLPYLAVKAIALMDMRGDKAA